MISLKPLLARLGTAIVWNTASTIAIQGGTFVSTLVVANLIGPDGFGQFGLVVGTAQALAAVLQFSTGIAATKYVSEFRERDKRRASLALTFCARVSLTAGAIGTAVLLAASSLIATEALRAPGLVVQLLLASPLVFFSVLSGFQIGALAGLDGFKSAARVLLTLTPVQIGTAALAAYFYGLSGAIVATVLNLGVRALVCHRLIGREARRQGVESLSGDRPFSREILFTFLVPGSLSGLTAMPALWIATVELSKSSGGFEQVAFFNAAFAIRAILMIFPWILSSVGLAFLSNTLGTERQNHFKTLLLSSLAITCLAVTLGTLVTLAFGDLILRLYGAQFLAGFPVLQVLMISFVAEALTLPLLQALTSRGRMWSIFSLVLLPRDALLVVCAISLVREQGAVGLGLAHSIAFGFALLTTTALHLFQVRLSKLTGQSRAG